jgi:phosphatidylserine/phosphatidylglycerophosphate/cardiolipin synthase-like enzyme
MVTSTDALQQLALLPKGDKMELLRVLQKTNAPAQADLVPTFLQIAANTALVAIQSLGSEKVRLSLEAMLALHDVQPPPAEVVWTGPEVATALPRKTDPVLVQLLHNAKKEVLISAFRLTDSETIDAILSLPERNVRVDLFLDWSRYSPGQTNLPAETLAGVIETVEKTLKCPGVLARYCNHLHVWVDQRMFKPGHYSSLHAKLVAVDRQVAFVGSANLTDHGMDHNIELGIRTEDPALVHRLCAPFDELRESGAFVRVP